MGTIKTVHQNSNILSILLLILLIFPMQGNSQGNTLENDLTELEELIEKRAYKKALENSEILLEQYPATPQVQFAHATILEKLGRKNRAMEMYNNLISDYPDYPEPYNNLAISYANEGNYDSAISILESALSTNPSYETVYLNIKAIYDKLASDAYRVALNSDAPTVALSLASLDSIPMDVDFGDENNIVLAQTDTTVETEAVTNAIEAIEIVTPPAEPEAPEPEVVETIDLTRIETDQPTETTTLEENTQSEIEQENLLRKTQNEIRERVESWAAAWAAQNYDGYLSYYSGQFQPRDSLSLAEWKEQRRGRLLWREYIIVELTNMKIEVDGNSANAKFVQYYKSNIYEGTGNKTLKLIQNNGQWFITQELI